MNEERIESARHICTACGEAVDRGVISPDGEAICKGCLKSVGLEELLVLCDLKDTEELLTALGYFAL